MLKRLAAACIVALGLILAPDAVRFVWATCETILATDPTKVNTSGDTMTGTLSMDNAPISLTGAGGTITSQSSVTASAFFGDGSALTGILSGPGYFGAGVILSSHVANGAIQTAKMDTDAVTAVKILAGAVETAKLGVDAVTSGAIRAAAVTEAKLAADAVTTVKVLDAAIQTAKLATDSVTAAKILPGAVETAKIVAGAINSLKLADAAVETQKLATDSVTPAKLLYDANSLWKVSGGGLNFNSSLNNLTGLGGTANGSYSYQTSFRSDVRGDNAVGIGGVGGGSYGTGSVQIGGNSIVAGAIGGAYYAGAVAGLSNTCNGFYSFCGAGTGNANAHTSAPVFGQNNTLSGTASYTGILYGRNNTVPSGMDDSAAMGRAASVKHIGAFVANLTETGQVRYSSGPYSYTWHSDGGHYFVVKNSTAIAIQTDGTVLIGGSAAISGTVDTSKLGTDSVTAVKILSDTATLAKVSGGNMAATSTSVTFFGSTGTVSGGQLSFPVQPGARASTLIGSGLGFPLALAAGSNTTIYWSTATSSYNANLYNDGNTIAVHIDSSTFVSKGVGKSWLECCVNVSATGASGNISVGMLDGSSNGVKEIHAVPAANFSNNLFCARGIMRTTNGQAFQCKVATDSDITINPDLTGSGATFQRLF